MDSLKIDTGAIKLLINDGPDCIEFNPKDTVFAEKYYALLKTLNKEKEKYLQRAEAIDANKEKDADGIDANAPEKLQFMRDVCEFMNKQIDAVFGPGTSKKLFGSVLNIYQYEQFFQGVTPFIQKARTEKIQQYVPPASVKRKKHAAMK
jgi:hypothetical protein